MTAWRKCRGLLPTIGWISWLCTGCVGRWRRRLLIPLLLIPLRRGITRWWLPSWLITLGWLLVSLVSLLIGLGRIVLWRLLIALWGILAWTVWKWS